MVCAVAHLRMLFCFVCWVNATGRNERVRCKTMKNLFFYFQVVQNRTAAQVLPGCSNASTASTQVITLFWLGTAAALLVLPGASWHCCQQWPEIFVLYTAGNRNDSSCWITEIYWFISCRSGKYWDDNLLAFFSINEANACSAVESHFVLC